MSARPRKPRVKKPSWSQPTKAATPEPVADSKPRRKVRAPSWSGSQPCLQGADDWNAETLELLGQAAEADWDFSAPAEPDPAPAPPARPALEEAEVVETAATRELQARFDEISDLFALPVATAEPPRLQTEVEQILAAPEKAPAPRPPRPVPPPPSRYEWVRARPASPGVFFRQFATMYRAGIHIDRVLSVLGQTTGEDPMMGVVCAQLGESIRQGNSLSQSMQAFPNVFTRLELNSVKVGETTGRLHLVLGVLADNRERELALSMKIRSALTYPAILFAIMALMLLAGPPLFFDGLFKVMQSFKLELPWITRVLLAWSNLLRDPAALIGLGLGLSGIVYAARQLWQRPAVRLEAYRRGMRAPVAGKLLVSLSTARLAQSLEVLMAAGVNMGTSLGLALESTDNPLVEARAPAIIDSVMNGRTLAASFRQSGLFSMGFLHMLEAGEETGTVVSSLQRSARFYQWEVDLAVDSFTTLLEPLMLLSMGLTVGAMIIATTLPFMDLLKTL